MFTTMKKTVYIAPAVFITKIHVENMIAESVNGVAGVDGLSVGGTSSEAGVTTGNVKSESYNVWDDDWSR